jgi:hypothetical protein
LQHWLHFDGHLCNLGTEANDAYLGLVALDVPFQRDFLPEGFRRLRVGFSFIAAVMMGSRLVMVACGNLF